MYYIGVDLGTSAVKLLMTEKDGTIVNSVTKEYPLYFPQPGWSEQKPEDWKAAVRTWERADEKQWQQPPPP